MKAIPAVQIYSPSSQQDYGYWRQLSELDTASESDRPPGAPPSSLDPQGLSRRRMLQLLGASTALAGLSGCQPPPEEWLVPRVDRIDAHPAGRPRYFATAVPVAGYAHGVVVETRDGRPIKVEGNPDHPATLGACDAIAQASVLSLYDPDRSRSITWGGRAVAKQELLEELARCRRRWDDSGGRGLAIVSDATTSPSQVAALQKVLERWPEARWIVHEPVDRGPAHRASEAVFGEPLEPVYDFSRARCVLSLDADVLQAQPGFLRYARDLSQRRQLQAGAIPLRLYAIEASPSLCGAVADHRLARNPQEIELAARQLAHGLGVAVAPPAQAVLPQAWQDSVLSALREAGPGALVVAGEQQSQATQMLAALINAQLGSIGRAVRYIPPVAAQGAPEGEGMEELVGAMNRGEVRDMLVLNCNPVFSGAGELHFADAYQQLAWRCHFGEYRDETGRASHWHVPACHVMESWADLAAYDGSLSLVQPLAVPLHGAWTSLQMLALLLGEPHEDARALLQRFWRERYQAQRGGDGFEQFWQTSLINGVVADSAPAQRRPAPLGDWSQRLPAPVQTETGLVLQLRPDPGVWDGRYANNGWLQEMPRPLTTLSWQNALLISPQLAQQRGWKTGRVVTVSTGAGQVRAPVFPLPGQAPTTVTLHFGQGHHGLGAVADGCGSNAYTLRSKQSPWLSAVQLIDTGKQQALALMQQHHHIEGRDLVRVGSLAQYQAKPDFAQRPGEKSLPSLYPEPEPSSIDETPGPAWAMTIDLSACIGCNACVTACQAENNIPVVGQEEVSRGHDMHWIRVDRYFSGPADDPAMVFQPVPCMHCENAPCEYVCPVGATQHSSEGLNQMIYQRCIGTRYCSQNCPYKVRRFNWFDYNTVDAAYPPAPARQNPEVTVRSRGVMEKCSYCVQRIQNAGQRAEAEHRDLADGEVQTACQQACPTRAIVFGDRKQAGSAVSAKKASPRNYDMLGHLNVRPRTSYLAAVRNPDPALEPLSVPSNSEGEQ